MTWSVSAPSLSSGLKSVYLFPSASSAIGRNMHLAMAYGTHIDMPWDFFPSSLQMSPPILNSHPLPRTAFSALSAPRTHRKQRRRRNLSHSTSLDDHLLELCHYDRDSGTRSIVDGMSGTDVVLMLTHRTLY